MPDMFWCSAAAATNNIYKTFPGPFFQEMRGFFRLFFIEAHGIRETSIRISRSETGRDFRKLCDMRPHFSRTQRTIQTHAEWSCVSDGSIKCFEGLSTQRPSTGIRDRAADHDGQWFFLCITEIFFDGEDGSFRIQCIKNGFYQKQIHSTIYQS